jgi:hypothetical protein
MATNVALATTQWSWTDLLLQMWKKPVVELQLKFSVVALLLEEKTIVSSI